MTVRAKTLPRVSDLTPEQELALRIGEVPGSEAFESVDEMREAWFRHKDALGDSNVGTRWSGWWLFEGPDGKDGVGYASLGRLIECGELRPDEVRRLRSMGGRFWKPEHEVAWAKRRAREAAK